MLENFTDVYSEVGSLNPDHIKNLQTAHSWNIVSILHFKPLLVANQLTTQMIIVTNIYRKCGFRWK